MIGVARIDFAFGLGERHHMVFRYEVIFVGNGVFVFVVVDENRQGSRRFVVEVAADVLRRDVVRPIPAA